MRKLNVQTRPTVPTPQLMWHKVDNLGDILQQFFEKGFKCARHPAQHKMVPDSLVDYRSDVVFDFMKLFSNFVII